MENLIKRDLQISQKFPCLLGEQKQADKIIQQRADRHTNTKGRDDANNNFHSSMMMII